MISILDFLSNASEKLEEIYSKKVISHLFKSNLKEILNDDFIPNMIEKILYYDIEVRLSGFNECLSKISQILNGNINKIKKESELQAKINDILSAFKQSPTRASASKHPNLFSYDKSGPSSKIDDLQTSLNVHANFMFTLLKN